MAFPIQPSDIFKTINQIAPNPTNPNLSGGWSDGGAGFAAQIPPGPSGLTTREGQVPPYRDAITARNMMRWLVPEQPIIEMYINPRRVQYNYSKLINNTRTKGGYVLQYWGENLTKLSIDGTTGTSGIEGINVLYDIYRNEQLMFDPFALTLQAERDKIDQESFDSLLFGNSILSDLENISVNLKQAQRGYYNSLSQTRNKPTLASLAFTVELYWCGEVYRGFFEGFDVTEDTDNLGLFNYNIKFTATQKRGFRTNYLPWQKSPVHGPSQSDNTKSGPPYSFGLLVNEQPAQQSATQYKSSTIIDAFKVF